MKGSCKNNLMSTSVIYCQKINLSKAVGLRIYLFVMIIKLRKINKKGIFTAVLTDLSKTCKCIPHILLIVFIIIISVIILVFLLALLLILV